MIEANASAMRNRKIANGARGPNGGLRNLHPRTLVAGTLLVRFGGKAFDAVIGPTTPPRVRSSKWGPIDEPDGTPLPRTLSGSGGFAGTVAGGEWWLEFSEYLKVERFADRPKAKTDKLAINVAIRRLCFVPLQWSDLGVVIQAKLIQPLGAYQGLGNPATGIGSTGKELTYDRHGARAEQIRQLFIPGLSDPDLRQASLIVTGIGFLPTAAD